MCLTGTPCTLFPESLLCLSIKYGGRSWSLSQRKGEKSCWAILRSWRVMLGPRALNLVSQQRLRGTARGDLSCVRLQLCACVCDTFYLPGTPVDLSTIKYDACGAWFRLYIFVYAHECVSPWRCVCVLRWMESDWTGLLYMCHLWVACEKCITSVEGPAGVRKDRGSEIDGGGRREGVRE